MYGSTTKGGVVKRSDCIPVYGSTTKGGVVKRSDWILHLDIYEYDPAFMIDVGFMYVYLSIIYL